MCLSVKYGFPAGAIANSWEIRQNSQGFRTYLHIITKSRKNIAHFLFLLQNHDFTKRQKGDIIYATKFVIL